MTTDPTSTERDLREQLYHAMDGNLRMSRRRELLAAYRDAILTAAAPPAAEQSADAAEAHEPITAGPLRRFLAGLPDDMPVIRANSPEGNGFSPLATADGALYLAGSPYAGEWYPDAAYRAANPDEQHDEAPDGTVSAVFLWPAS